MNNQTLSRDKPLYKPALLGFWLIVLAIVVAMLGPLGSRIGWWNFDTAVLIAKWSAYTGLVAAVACLSGLFMARPGGKRRGFIYSVLGLLILTPMIIYLQYWKHAKATLPPIQDITTNTEAPPTFWYAPNSRVYGGAAIAAWQEEAYPDIQPLILPVSMDNAYRLVIELIKENGWQLYTPNQDEMHIEATVTTFWFGFSDDVVIHITEPAKGSSRIDMRSTSRFGGGGDGGTNANRIRSFFKALSKRVKVD